MQIRIGLFVSWLVVIAAVFWRTLPGIFETSMKAEYSSHIVLMPFILAYLIWNGREKIFARPSYAWTPAMLLSAGAVALVLTTKLTATIPSELAPTLTVFEALVLLTAAFLGCFGVAALRAALFPVLMMLFLLPLPETAVGKVITVLQVGSARLSAGLFSVLGVPVYRDGVLLSLPGVTVEVAKECSGINSTVALLIMMLLAAYETLQRNSSRFLFILISIPLSFVKNAIRIVTLVLLATYVNPGFLTGRLHHQGGFVFFGIALALMYPVWKLLKKIEKRSLPVAGSQQVKAARATAVGS